MDDKCSVCNEEMRSPYVFQEFLGNGKTRLYTGHKRCLGLVKSRLEEEEQLRYEEIDISEIKNLQKERDESDGQDFQVNKRTKGKGKKKD